MRKRMLLQQGPAGDHADAASWGHGTALSRIWERDHRSTPDIRAPQDRPLRGQAGGSQGSGRWRHGTGRRRGRRVRKRSSGRIPYEEPNKLGFPPFGLGCLSYSGDGRGVTGVTAPFFRERGGEAGRKEHRPDLEGKDTRRGAEKRKPAAAYGQPPVFHIAGSEDWR